MNSEPRRAVRGIVLGVAALLSLVGGPGIAGATPEELIGETATEVLVILRDDAMSFDQKSQKLETYLDARCDLATTAKLAMGRNWKVLSAPQQTEYTELFKQYLIYTYRDNINSYGGQTVDVTGGRPEERGDYTVHTLIKGGDTKQPIVVDYRLRKVASGDWRIIDVIAEGISLISNLRSQFQEIISTRGADGLLRTLREKIERT
jgi:phospholipid transport system substrate-binding protein